MPWKGCFLTKTITTKNMNSLYTDMRARADYLLPGMLLSFLILISSYSVIKRLIRPKTPTEPIWVYFQHGCNANQHYGTKPIPSWTENKILQPRPISGQYFSWNMQLMMQLVQTLTTQKAIACTGRPPHLERSNLKPTSQPQQRKNSVLALSCPCQPACISDLFP